MSRSWFIAGVIACLGISSCARPEMILTVKNPSPVQRKSETVEVLRSELQASDKSLGGEDIVVVDQASGTELLSQVSGELLLFQSDFAPGETKTFLVTSGRKAENASRVDGYYAVPREDYAWENDRIAFRMYGPALAASVSNGIDVWTKRVRSLIVRKWYEGDAKEGKGNYYHIDRGEGADFFEVGKTLGAGGSGIWYKDSLYQPGVFSSYRTLANGPIRTSFELTYINWNVDGKKFAERKRISLDAGQSLNRIEVEFSGVDPRDSLLIGCGLVKRKGVSIQTDEKLGELALWGPTNDDPANGSLGTGLLLIPSTIVGKREDSTQVILLGRLSAGQPFVYRAGAGWTRGGDFDSANSWDNYLKEVSITLTEPLQLTMASRR